MIEAVTVYGPAMALAVAVALAAPDALVTADATAADAPVPGAVNATVVPATALPKLSVTVAASGAANTACTVADWLSPPAIAIAVAAPGALVSAKLTAARPAAPAVTLYAPATVPAVAEVWAMPLASVSALPGRQDARAPDAHLTRGAAAPERAG